MNTDYYSTSWRTGSCDIVSINSNSAQVNLLNQSIFMIEVKPTGACDIGRGPIATACVLFFLWILTSIIFCAADKEYKKMRSAVFGFLLYYPLTSI